MFKILQVRSYIYIYELEMYPHILTILVFEVYIIGIISIFTWTTWHNEVLQKGRKFADSNFKCNSFIEIFVGFQFHWSLNLGGNWKWVSFGSGNSCCAESKYMYNGSWLNSVENGILYLNLKWCLLQKIMWISLVAFALLKYHSSLVSHLCICELDNHWFR